jgi:hypothetical protein
MPNIPPLRQFHWLRSGRPFIPRLKSLGLSGRLGKTEYKYSSDDNSTTVGENVHKMMQNVNIKSDVVNIINTPLIHHDITSISSYLKNHENDSRVQFGEKEAAAIKQYGKSEIPVTSETVVHESTFITYLNPKRGSFEGAPRDWRFGKGEETITATIKDDTFLQKLQNGDIRLYVNDRLKVKLLERQKLQGNEVVSTTYEVLKVLEYKESPRQESLSLK